MDIFPLLPWDIKFLIMKYIPSTFNVCKKYKELLDPIIKGYLSIHPTKKELLRAARNLYYSSKIIFINKRENLLHVFKFNNKRCEQITYPLDGSQGKRKCLYQGVEEGHFIKTKVEILVNFIEKNHTDLIYDKTIIQEALINRPYENFDARIELYYYFESLGKVNRKLGYKPGRNILRANYIPKVKWK